MNSLYNLKIFFNNAFISNKKFILIPYTKRYYTIVKILKNKEYIKNFTCITSNNINNLYLLIEFKYINNCIKKFKIILFNIKLKVFKYIYKNLVKLYKFTGLFLFDTSLGILTLEQMKICKIGGFLFLYIY